MNTYLKRVFHTLNVLSLSILTANAYSLETHDNLTVKQKLCIDDNSGCQNNIESQTLPLAASGIPRISLTRSYTVDDNIVDQQWRLLANSSISSSQKYFSINVGNTTFPSNTRIRFTENPDTERQSIQIGKDSEIVDGEVSIGSEELKRQLINIADAIYALDAINKSQLDELAIDFDDEKQRIEDLSIQVAALETLVDGLEVSVEEFLNPNIFEQTSEFINELLASEGEKDSSGGSLLFFNQPTNNILLLIGTLLLLQLTRKRNA